MSTAGRSRKQDAHGDGNSDGWQQAGTSRAAHSDRKAAGPTAGSMRSQPQKVLAIPQESLASNQGRTRGFARPPAGPGQQASNRVNTQQQQPQRTSNPRLSPDPQQTAAAPTPPQVQPATAPKAGGAWAKPGELVQRLGSREQSESGSTSANTSQGSTPTSQGQSSLPHQPRADPQAGPRKGADTAAAVQQSKHTSSEHHAVSAADPSAQSAAQPSSADRTVSDPAGKAQPQRSHRRKSASREPRQQEGQQMHQPHGRERQQQVSERQQEGTARPQDRPVRQDRAEREGGQPRQDVQSRSRPRPVEAAQPAPPQQPELQQQQQQQQMPSQHPQLQHQPQQQQRRGQQGVQQQGVQQPGVQQQGVQQQGLQQQGVQQQGVQQQGMQQHRVQQPGGQQQRGQQQGGQQQGRQRPDGGARHMPPVNLGRPAPEGPAARPPSTPAASEPPRAFSGEVGQTPAGPGSPLERCPAPSTPTPATPHAGQPVGESSAQAQHGQGPFAQDHPSSSLPPPFDLNQPDQYQLQLPSTVFISEYAAMSLPGQHDSSPSALSAPSGSALPPNFRFGSFSPEDGGKPSSSESLGFSMLSQQEQHSGVLFGSIGPLGQLEPSSVPVHPTGQIELPFGPGPQGLSPGGQPPIAPSPAPVSGSALGQMPGAKHSAPKPNQPPVSPVQGSLSTAQQPSMGAGTVSDASQAPNAMSLSPLPTRADSTVSTSSQGPSNPDGRRSGSRPHSGSSSGSRQHQRDVRHGSYQHGGYNNQRGYTNQRGQPPPYPQQPQDPHWAQAQAHSHDGHWNPAGFDVYQDPHYPPTYGNAWNGYNGGFNEAAGYDHLQMPNYWDQGHQPGYYEDQQWQQGYAPQPPQARGRGRGYPNPNRQFPNQANQPYQQLLAQQLFAQQQHQGPHFRGQLMPGQHQLPAQHLLGQQQHGSHQGSHHGSQHGSQQASPQHSPQALRTQGAPFPDVQLPRTLSDQAQPPTGSLQPQPYPQHPRIPPSRQPSTSSSTHSHPAAPDPQLPPQPAPPQAAYTPQGRLAPHNNAQAGMPTPFADQLAQGAPQANPQAAPQAVGPQHPPQELQQAQPSQEGQSHEQQQMHQQLHQQSRVASHSQQEQQPAHQQQPRQQLPQPSADSQEHQQGSTDGQQQQQQQQASRHAEQHQRPAEELQPQQQGSQQRQDRPQHAQQAQHAQLPAQPQQAQQQQQPPPDKPQQAQQAQQTQQRKAPKQPQQQQQGKQAPQQKQTQRQQAQQPLQQLLDGQPGEAASRKPHPQNAARMEDIEAQMQGQAAASIATSAAQSTSLQAAAKGGKQQQQDSNAQEQQQRQQQRQQPQQQPQQQSQQQLQQRVPWHEATSTANMPSTANAAASSAPRPHHPPPRATPTGHQASDKSRAAPSIPASDSCKAVRSGPGPTSTAVKPAGGTAERPAVPKLMSWAAMVSVAGASPGPAPAHGAAPQQQRSQRQHPASTAQPDQDTQHAQHAQQPVRQAGQQSDRAKVQAEESLMPSSAAAEEAAREAPAETSIATQDSSAAAENIQAASASAPGLKAPSSLAVGAAIPTTKQAVFSQTDAQRPGPGETGRDKAPSAAATAPAGKAPQSAAAAAAAVAKPEKPAVERMSLEGLDEAVANGLRALCQTGPGPDRAAQGIRLMPRGLKNSGNLCFMNATLQALMAGSSFCGFADALRAAAPALTPTDFPHLEAFARLAKEFPVLKATQADEEESQQPQRGAHPEQPQPKAGPDQARPDSQDDQAEETPEAASDDGVSQDTVGDVAAASDAVTDAPLEVDADAKSESSKAGTKADAQTDNNSSAAAAATTQASTQAASQVDARPRGARSDSKAEGKEATRADGKAAPKGSRASSRQPSSDGGPDGKSAKAMSKAPPTGNSNNAKSSGLQLGGPALVPDMMYRILDIFNPSNARLLAATAAGQQLTMAQKISRGVTKVAKQREQEDAQEFLTSLLNRTHDELLKLRAMYGTQDSATTTSYDENWEHVSRKGKSNVTRGQEDIQGGRTLTSQIFGGTLQSTVKAARAKASVTVQPFNLLHLDINSSNNVVAALQMLTIAEDIHDYKATDESAPVTAKKEIKLLRLPQILVLHMCRFTYAARGLNKLHKSVQFPIKLKIQQQLLADDCEQRRQGGADYELIASVSHHGKSPSSGHYTADVRQPDGEWLRFDDDFVSIISVKQVLQRDTEMYLLFYEMKPQTS